MFAWTSIPHSSLVPSCLYDIPISLLDFLDVAARNSQHTYIQLIRAYRVPVLNSGFLSSWDKLMFHGLCVVRRHAYIRIPYPYAQIAVYPQSSIALDISNTGHESAARRAVVLFFSSILGSRLLALIHGMPESHTCVWTNNPMPAVNSFDTANTTPHKFQATCSPRRGCTVNIQHRKTIRVL